MLCATLMQGHQDSVSTVREAAKRAVSALGKVSINDTAQQFLSYKHNEPNRSLSTWIRKRRKESFKETEGDSARIGLVAEESGKLLIPPLEECCGDEAIPVMDEEGDLNGNEDPQLIVTEFSDSNTAFLAEAIRERQYDLAMRIVLLSHDTNLMKQTLSSLTWPRQNIVAALSVTTANALCAALLELLSSYHPRNELWLIFYYLQQFVVCKDVFSKLDWRILRAVERQLFRHSTEADQEAVQAATLLNIWESAVAETQICPSFNP